MGSMNRTLILVNERASLPDMPVVLDREGWGPEPVEGVDITRPVCRCKFGQGDAELGQGCSAPTAGGSGSAEFGAGEGSGEAGDSNIGTIVLVGAAGAGLLALLGVI
jgi:hypothetical protein